MSPNSDNAMARFLFAILKQKNLKDIDWNQVAEDPVLLQPISNGHAARMRYSRFRATVTNNEGRSSKSKANDKSRVSKSKSKRDGSIKSEGSISHIKQESPHNAPLSYYSPASTTSPYLSDNRDDFGARFLTPCSDDMAQVLSAGRPVMDMNCPPPGAFSPPVDFINPGLIHSPNLSAFDDAAFDMANFGMEGQPSHISEGHQHDWNDRLENHF